MKNARAYNSIIHPKHFITRKEKCQSVVRTVSAVAIFIRNIFNYPCLNAASTSDDYSATHWQYNDAKSMCP